MRDIKDNDELDIDDIIEEERDGLAELIVSRYRDAESARNETFFAGRSINEWLKESYDRYTGNFDNEKFQLIRIKTDVVHAKVKDMTVGSIDAPFVIKPTPIPELSTEQTESIQIDLEDALGRKLVESGIVEVDEGDGSVRPRFEAVMETQHKMLPSVAEWLENQAKQQKKSVQYEAGRIAGEASRRATTVMLDQMIQGKWKKANLEADFDDFLYGTGCIREEIKGRKELKWVGTEFKETVEEQITYRHVPIHNCYPSPDSEHAQDGTYFIEKSAMRKQDLIACKELDWFDNDLIEQAMEEASVNYEWLEDNPEVNTGWGDDQLVSVLIHEGTVSGETLNEYWGYEEDDEDYKDPFSFYDIEAYVLAGVVMGCRVLKFPYGKRSYYSSCYKTAGKSFWGIGIAMLLAYREDKLNGYECDIETNLEKTVSPPIFYNVNMFERGTDVKSGLTGRGKLIPYNSDPAMSNGTVPNVPYHQVRFDSKTAELTSLFARDYRLADDESGIPSLLSGNSDLKGGESTFRGMKLLLSTSNIIIKAYFHNKDETRIQPAMQNLWYWNMLNNDDPSIKADAKIVARGVAGLMAQEIANAERLEVMPVIMQLLQGTSLPEHEQKNIIDYLLKETMVTGGLPADELMTDPAVEKEQNQVIEGLLPNPSGQQVEQPVVQGANGNASIKPATPAPTIGNDNNLGGLT